MEIEVELLAECQPITELVDLDVANVAVLDLLDILEEVTPGARSRRHEQNFGQQKSRR